MDEHFDKYSDEEAYRVAYLIAGYIRETLSETEHNELDVWVAASDENMLLFERLTDEKNREGAIQWIERRNTSAALENVKEKIAFTKEGKGRGLRKIISYAIAASVLIIMGLWIYSSFIYKKENSSVIVENLPADILPGSDKATLTLEDGTILLLDKKLKDTSINGQIKILQENGEIAYSGQAIADPTAYHTLTIPRKGHYKLLLPDGTKVWLNAASSIRYPIAFSGTERKVFVTGEAYFEVAKDKTKPFRVVANDLVVEALGTAFNVNAYADEPYISTTLLEGSVLITKGNTENVLKPGQQARVAGTEFSIINAAGGEVTAWKNNQFKFTDLPLDVIMRQIERWYDAEIIYENKPADHFNAEISRDVPVSKLLHILELTNRVHFNIEGNKIIVKN